jgi:hypothetical protein
MIAEQPPAESLSQAKPKKPFLKRGEGSFLSFYFGLKLFF